MMKTETSEYLNGDDQGQQGEKKFTIQKARDPDFQKILDGRMAVLTNSDLHDGAKVLFTLLLELALNPFIRLRVRGQVAISNTQLRERLSRSARAIYGWTHELVFHNHIWLSKLPRPNMHAMNVFHITALQPQRPSEPELPGDGVWGNGYRRLDQAMPLGARGGTCKKRHYLFDRFGAPLFVQPVANEPATRKDCGSLPQSLREPPAKKDTCHPQSLREPPAQKDTSHPQSLREPPAKNDTSPQQKGAVLREAGDVRSSDVKSLFNVQRGNAFKKGGESGFVQQAAIVLAQWDAEWAKAEMKNSGGWWVSKFRQDQDKACRVLAEINRMIKEGVSFSENPGACAVDLWKRFA
jgi:hypothetical protein